MKRSENKAPTILVVDDEYAVVAALTNALLDAGFRVISVGDAAAAEARLQKTKCDAVVCGLAMSAEDGALRARLATSPKHRDTPFILMREAYAPQAPADAHVIEKPVKLDILLALIAKLLKPREPE